LKSNLLQAITVLYLYLDETYAEDSGYWHCNIGGALVSPTAVVSTELALSQCIYDSLKDIENVDPFQEFKYSDFFRSIDDTKKLDIAKAICKTAIASDIRFLVSYAKCRADRLDPIAKNMGGCQAAIQSLAFFNMSNFLAPYTSQHPVQAVVDLGLSESFRPIYQMYVGHARGLTAVKMRGVRDIQITIPNYSNLPVPLFVDSHDSRLIQLSDLLIGTLLAKNMRQSTGFKGELIDTVACLDSRIALHSIEWNADKA
jgi:hypothetical protein